MKYFLAACMALASSGAMACKVVTSPDDLARALADPAPDRVVFTGWVTAVDTAIDPARPRITLRATRWWRGSARPTVVVLGAIRSARGTSCEGVFDFTASVGATMLIIGDEEGAVVLPSSLLSRELKDGTLPPELEHAH